MSVIKMERWWSFALLVLVLVVSAASEPLSEEGLALLAMKASFADPLNNLETWKLNGTATPCLWSGIACNNLSSVVGLYLAHMNLTGTLSGDLGRLRNLVTISIEFNNFTGPVPLELTFLSQVTYLNISNNNFTGAFPANLSHLQSLQVIPRPHFVILSIKTRTLHAKHLTVQVLDAFNNNFVGPLPGDLWLIPTLEHLSLGGNYFEGSIPPQYGSFPALKYLGLNGNSLTGAIPPELGNLQGSDPNSFHFTALNVYRDAVLTCAM